MVLYMSVQRCATSSVDRVPGYEPVGRRFESCVARKNNRFPLESVIFLCFCRLRSCMAVAADREKSAF